MKNFFNNRNLRPVSGIAFLILILFLASTWTLYQYHNNTWKRKRFEHQLRDQYKKASARPEKKPENGKPDQPGTAAFMDYLMTFDPAMGKVPRERSLKAFRQTRQMMSFKQTSSLQWTSTGSAIGGRTRMIMYDPNDPSQKKVWAGGITGGLWFNNDISNQYSAWIPVGDFWPNLAIRCMTYDPNNPQIFYIGTGEAETALITYRESSGLGDGIWKSIDGGVTWNQLPSTVNFSYVTKIVVRNEAGQSVIYAGVASGTYKGTQHQSSPSDGLFRSSDGGASWTQVLPDIPGSTVPFSVADVALGSDGKLYVGSMPNLDEEGGATMLFSDDGVSFDINEDYKMIIENDTDYAIPGRVVFGTAPSDPNVVYALISSGKIDPADNFKDFYCFHILRSADKGATWTIKSQPMNLTYGFNFATLAWHALDIAVDPNNPDIVFIGGLDVHKSTNGGNSWNRVSDWSLMTGGGGPQYIHADQHVILFKPESSSEIVFGTDGGIFFTSNGTNYQPVFSEHNQDYSTLQFYTCALHPTAGSDYYLGGLQDNGTLYYTGTPLALQDMINGGDGAFCFYDQNDPSLFITSLYFNQYYVYKYGTLTNFLMNWSSGTFINPADLDYELNILYANAVDYIGTHQDMLLRIKNLLYGSTGQFLTLNTGSTVSFSAVTYSRHSPVGKSTLFIGSQSGRLFMVTEAQSNSPQTNEIGDAAFPAANISSIEIGKSEDTLLVTFSNYGVSSVWLTTDGGESWEEKEGNLPDMPVRWGLFHTDDARHVLLATETGVWLTSNINATSVIWEPAVEGMANVRTDMLRMRNSDNTVLAATHGRGLFTTTWDIVTGHDVLKTPAEISLFPNPVHGSIYLDMKTGLSKDIKVVLYDLSGKKVMEQQLPGSVPVYHAKIDLSTVTQGNYIITVCSGDKRIKTENIVIF